MAGMIPDKKTIQEIERDYEELQTKHNRLVESWLKARFEPVGPNEQECKTEAAVAFDGCHLI